MQATEIHFQQTKVGLLLVPVNINGQGPFDFILDTGNAAVPFLFSRALAERFGIAAGNEIPNAYALVPRNTRSTPAGWQPSPSAP